MDAPAPSSVVTSMERSDRSLIHSVARAARARRYAAGGACPAEPALEAAIVRDITRPSFG